MAAVDAHCRAVAADRPRRAGDRPRARRDDRRSSSTRARSTWPSRARSQLAQARRCRRAVAGVREPRPVRELRRARRALSAARARASAPRMRMPRDMARPARCGPSACSRRGARSARCRAIRGRCSIYDASLAWCAILLLAIGLVMVYSASIAMAEASAHTGFRSWYFLARHAMFIAVGVLRGVRRVPDADEGVAAPRAVDLRRRRRAARARVRPRHRQVGQRLAPLALARRRQRAALRIHEARGRAVRRELRGAQGGVPACRAAAEADAGQGLPAAVRRDGRRRRRCCCSSPTSARSS